MHDDLCTAMAQSKWNPKVFVHCWREPNHGGDHFDRDLNIYWRQAGNVVSLGPARRLMPWHRRGVKAA